MSKYSKVLDVIIWLTEHFWFVIHSYFHANQKKFPVYFCYFSNELKHTRLFIYLWMCTKVKEDENNITELHNL